jgi:DNA-binding NarL/FixJ family response regulator
MNQTKNESVLLIECHPADAHLITNALHNDVQQGLQVESFKKLSDGVDRIHKGRVRGVIVDIEMPNGRGVTAFERLRAAAPHLPILILSGVENENVAKQAVDRGAQNYLLKTNLDHFRLNDISSNPDNAMILSALINIGKSLKHRVVAEGVETKEQLHFLQKEGCSEGQGHFFCRPVIAEKFAQFLERGVTESVVH